MKDTTIRRTAALFAAAALTAPGAAWATSDSGKGGERPETAPGQVKPAGEPAAPAHARVKGAERSQAQAGGRSEGAPHGNAYGHEKQAAKAKPQPQGNAYGRTQPAQPRGAKPATTPAPASKAKSENGMAHQKTTLCHATGSETNPYVTITISDAAVQAHARHQDGRDIIPANGECPGPAGAKAPAGALGGEQTVTKGGEQTVTAQGALPGAGDVLSETETADGPAPAAQTEETPADGRSGVLGEFAERELGAPGASGTAGTPAAGVAGETDEATDREAGADSAAATLPYTGLELWVVLVAGLALLLAGITAKRAAATRA